MTPRKAALTLVTGPTPAAREAAIAALVAARSSADLSSQDALPAGQGPWAVILEGLPDGRTILYPSEQLLLQRIAPGCLCCTGNLVLRVTLNRILRLQPDRLFIGLASTDHLDQLRSWLQSAPYDQLLEPSTDLHT